MPERHDPCVSRSDIRHLRGELSQLVRDYSDVRERVTRTEEIAKRIERLEPKIDLLFGALGKLTAKFAAMRVRVYLLVSGVAGIVTFLVQYFLG